MKLFTSEFVSSGHPDRYCDTISNKILDKCLEEDPSSRVAVEALAKNNRIIIGGEITSKCDINLYIDDIVNKVTSNTGYDFIPIITNLLDKQSPNIAAGTNDDANGAGDQGIMFGYATNEGPNYMPLAWSIAKDIIKTFETLRVDSPDFGWVKPDMKSQVTIEYSGERPKVKTVVVSIQTEVGTDVKDVRDRLVIPTVKSLLEVWYGDYVDISEDFKVLFNETGIFEIGGPYGDCGVTGRKIVCDQYGGYAPVGGGNLNGKDATKVDRSAAYMMRYLAKNIVHSGILSDCTIQCAYCIGVSQPVSLYITTSDLINRERLENLEKNIMKTYDLSPKGIIDFFELRKPIYVKYSKYGAYGSPDAPWERIDEEFINKIEGRI